MSVEHHSFRYGDGVCGYAHEGRFVEGGDFGGEFFGGEVIAVFIVVETDGRAVGEVCVVSCLGYGAEVFADYSHIFGITFQVVNEESAFGVDIGVFVFHAVEFLEGAAADRGKDKAVLGIAEFAGLKDLGVKEHAAGSGDGFHFDFLEPWGFHGGGFHIDAHEGYAGRELLEGGVEDF